MVKLWVVWSPPASVAVTSIWIEPSVSWSSEAPAARRSSLPTTSKRASLTEKLWLSPTSWSVALSVPMTAPAAAFSATSLAES